jgi:hypothetical protein
MSELIGARRTRRSTVNLGTQLDSVEMPLTPATNGNGNGNGHSPHPASAPQGHSEPAG